MGLDALINTTNFGKDTVFPMMMDGYNDVVQVRNKAAALHALTLFAITILSSTAGVIVCVIHTFQSLLKADC